MRETTVRKLSDLPASLIIAHFETKVAHRDSYIKTLEASEMALVKEIALLRNFIGKVQGTCMAVAMSDCHPNPDGALMALFQEAQDLLFPPKPAEEEEAA